MYRNHMAEKSILHTTDNTSRKSPTTAIAASPVKLQSRRQRVEPLKNTFCGVYAVSQKVVMKMYVSHGRGCHFHEWNIMARTV